MNFGGNFGRSLKSPWILKMILEILEFRVQYDLPSTSSQIAAAMRHTSMLHVTSLQFFSDMWLHSFVVFLIDGQVNCNVSPKILTSLKIMEGSLKNSLIILEFFRGNFVVTLWEVLKHSQFRMVKTSQLIFYACRGLIQRRRPSRKKQRPDNRKWKMLC